MKRLIIVALFLIIINSALGLTISVNPLQQVLGLNSNLTIDYEVNLDTAEDFNYSIRILNEQDNYLIIKEDLMKSPYLRQITHNVSNIKAGNYKIQITVNSINFNNLAVPSLNNVTITELSSFDVTGLGTVYTVFNETIKEFSIFNTGNTRMSFTAYFTGAESDITLTPQSFSLEPAETKTLRVIVLKPSESYTAQLNIIGVYETKQSTYTESVDVIVPLIKLNASNFNVTQSNNSTIINFELTNLGNMEVNYTVTLRTFDLQKGFTSTSFTDSINPGDYEIKNYELLKTQITGVTVEYNNGTQAIQINEQLSFNDLSTLNLDIDNNKLILIIIVVVILGVIFWNKFFKNKRP